MNITVTDTALLTPTGGIASNTPIKIVCLEGYDQVLTGAISEFTTDDAGAYSFPLYYGVHAIYVRFDTKFKLLGKVTITSELADTATISDLLLYTEPMLPDEIALVSGLVEEARGYAEDAESAKNESAAIKESLAPLDSVADIPNITDYEVGDKITWLGYYSPSDGGGNWGVVKEGAHTADGGSIFTISGDFYIEADHKGASIIAKKWGIVADGSTDDIDALDAVVSYASSIDAIGYIPIDITGLRMRITRTWYLPANRPVSGLGARFIGVTKDFDGIVILEGNGSNVSFDSLSGFDRSLVIQCNTSLIEFQTISESNQGVVIEAISQNLDNVVRGVQIGNCTEAIVFQQTAYPQTQQGNDIQINFVNGATNAVSFDDGGVHTGSSNWDANKVVIAATDSAGVVDAVVLKNNTSYSVPANKIHVDQWCGGFSDLKTLVEGLFSSCDIYLRLANAIDVDQVIDSSSADIFTTCVVKFAQSNIRANATTGTARRSVSSQDDSAFGNPMKENSVLIDCSLYADLSAGASVRQYFYHIGSFSGDSHRFTARAFNQTTNGLVDFVCEPFSADGVVAISIYNKSGSTLSSGQVLRAMVEYHP